MASVQDYKRRIRSVRNTRKITRAMELVAAAKLRRAQSRIEAMRPYADTMRELIAGVGRASGSVRGLPLLEQRETTATTLIVPLSGDRGLAGAFNAQVMRRAFALDRTLTGEGQAVRWLAVGKKGRSTLTFRRRTLDGTFTGFTDAPAYADAQAIAHRAAELFVEGEVDRVVLVYNTFVSALTQTVLKPLMRNSSAPAMTVMPSRAPSSVTTPSIGAVTVKRAWIRPVDSTSPIWSSVMPARRMRWRAHWPTASRSSARFIPMPAA